MTTFGAASATPFEEYYANTAAFAGARRLAADVASARAEYDSTAWSAMRRDERDRALDAAAVPDDVREKYANNGCGPSKPSLPNGVTSIYPRLKMKTGLKRVTLELEDGGAGSQGEDLDSASSGCVSLFTFLSPSQSLSGISFRDFL